MSSLTPRISKAGTTSDLHARINREETKETVSYFVDGMAVSLYLVRPTQDPMAITQYSVEDLGRGRHFAMTGEVNANRVALQIAKAYLFDIIAEYGIDRLPSA